MKRLIFIALLIMSGCGAAYAQPKVKLPEGVPSDSLSYLKIQKNNRGKYGYVYSSGNTETTYVKPVYDAVSEVLSISDEGTVRHISMVEYRSRWYLLDLANGMYMLLGTQGEFLSCPCLLESGGFIYETDEGRFFCETLADPDEKHVAIQREYALDDR